MYAVSVQSIEKQLRQGPGKVWLFQALVILIIIVFFADICTNAIYFWSFNARTTIGIH